MLHGVKINAVDTLEQYGLALAADLQVESPTLKENRIPVPGMDGSLNASYALTGGPVFNDIGITFMLISRNGQAEQSRKALMNLYNGREVRLTLPDDPDHYYHGVLTVGGVSEYNSGTIEMSMVAGPYKKRQTVTTVTGEVPAAGTLDLNIPNEGKDAMPKITCSADAQITYGTATYAVQADQPLISTGIILKAGDNAMTITAAAGTTVSVEYQEAVL